MTVILAISDNKHPIHLLSDVLLSTAQHVDEKVVLPHLSDGPERLVFGDRTLAGIAQKTINYGRTAFVWAGRQVVAHAILNEHFARSEGGNRYVPLSAVIQSMHLHPSESEDVGILTMFCDRKDNVVTCGHNIQHYDVPLGDGRYGKIHTAGSGYWDILENYQAARNRAVEYSLPIDIIHRFSIRTIEPFFAENESFAHMYGSWFELSYHDGIQFKKIPTAFMFWSRKSAESDFEGFGPLVYSTYYNENLYITTTMAGPESGVFASRTLSVADPLGRGAIQQDQSKTLSDEVLRFAPELFVHVLLTGEGNGDGSVLVCPYFIAGDPFVRVEKVGTSSSNPVMSEVSKELIDFVNGLKSEADLDVNTRPFS